MNRFALAPVQDGGADWARAATVVPPRLTPTQAEILAFVHRYQRMWGATPMYREIGKACGLRSDSSVAYQIQRLVQLGMLRKPPRLHRAVVLAVVPVTWAA
jgi:repressor LexA